MIREICKDPIFLSRRAGPAALEDVELAMDLLDTLKAHKDGCVGMAANMIGVCKGIIAFENQGNYMVMFNPEILNPEYTTPLANLVDQTIMRCPVDVRRPLYSNIVVAGGSTKFKGFDKRLSRDLKRIVKARYDANISAVRAKLQGNLEIQGKEMEVVVKPPKKREIASWMGGSYVASQVGGDGRVEL